MTPLKPYTAFPSKCHPAGARTTRYEIRRSNMDNTGSTRWPGDQPTRAGYETTYGTRERAQLACDRINAASGACVVINLRKEVLAELVAAEEGAYEDAVAGKGSGAPDDIRPLESHVHKVAQRFTSRLVIRTCEEAEDAYYAVCSGTFQLRNLACWRAAVRIADALRPFAKPGTVKMFPRPDEKPEV